MPRRRALRRGSTVAEVPAFRRADLAQLFHCQPVTGIPRPCARLDEIVDLLHPAGRFLPGELLAGLRALLQEVLLPERAAAEHAAGPGLHRHLDLALVIREIDTGR